MKVRFLALLPAVIPLTALLLALHLVFATAALAAQGGNNPTFASFYSGGRAIEHSSTLQQATPEPTRVRPTPTPIATPPPADPESTNLMIGFGVLAVVVVIVGVWLNRERTV